MYARLNVERTHTRETRGSRFLNNAHVLYRKCLFIVRNKYSARTYRSEWKLHALPPPALSCALDCTCIYLPIHCTYIYLHIHCTCIYLPIHWTCIYLLIHWTCIYFPIHWTCYTVNSCIAQTVTHHNYALYCLSLLLCVVCIHKFQYSVYIHECRYASIYPPLLTCTPHTIVIDIVCHCMITKS